MKREISDEEFWALVDSYESGDIPIDDCIEKICKATNSYEVAMADLSLLVKRAITREEKQQVKNLLRSN